ncbi:alpha/beta hydrolase [Mycobacteroides abscessus subsp. bolletii]|uniref:alpha/beta hydrolase n=1 Tax=Mycobacteroides abscessus TaxID=36809 RepID=UPI0019D22ED0|nr:alpha/beta hydrolase [Mycobacteroides abscessus]MBN7304814.1 alpha/beta hydrolase [Mycobacteroides abscessus subsp. bolletii]
MSEADRKLENKDSARILVERIATRRATRIFHEFIRVTLRKLLDLVAWAYRRERITRQQIVSACKYSNKTISSVLLQPAPGTRSRMLDLQGFRAEWIWGQGMEDPDLQLERSAILYLHGGGLLIGDLSTHRGLVAQIAQRSAIPVLNVEYRQITHGVTIDETLKDCLASYRYLLQQGIPATKIVLAGDSVGAGLCFFLALSARHSSLPMPGAIAAISPFVEFNLSKKLAHSNNKSEGVCSAEFYSLPVQWAIEKGGMLDPAWSLNEQNFVDFPPVFIQVGSHETLLLDSELIVERCAQAGVSVKMQIWEKALHDFHMDAHMFRDGFDAIEELSSFIYAAVRQET